MARLSFSCIFQSGIQNFIRPGWCPGIRSLHGHQETWKCIENTEERMREILNGLYRLVQDDDTGSFYDVHLITNDFIRILVFTWAEWLDVIEIKLHPEITYVKSFSTGLFPLSIPFACLLNVIFFWVPFLDKGLNKERIEKLRHRMALQLEVGGIN
ncbi:hypothetical protein LOTGIDRAFT_172913 [Lottia gigantea]|uniref:Uncharacterized protein n=1 Tax=Lottia gigantea TaxID=225164 RepID=V4AAI7_LOTGI|nr:hypothetical protein LOTGIDRAFT_172913 [Lottia gigantea]ESP00984.1 hypothetical protein LOTGIDRAFT_172913 [Lottia gigantea]